MKKWKKGPIDKTMDEITTWASNESLRPGELIVIFDSGKFTAFGYF